MLRLYGYRYSVYSWIVRLAMAEKRVDYEWVEVDPFAADTPDDYLAIHPFKRVPAIAHEAFALYETTAITRYIDATFGEPRLEPRDVRARARCHQIIAIADNYAYWPLVRQVFSHAVFRQRLGREADPVAIREGLASADRVLAAITQLSGDTPYLCGETISLADIHLAPMIGYFAVAREADAVLAGHPRLERWSRTMYERPTYRATMPELPSPPTERRG